MTLQEQLEIIQAAIDGKEIEFYSIDDNVWKTKNIKDNLEFSFLHVKYRIKPETKKEIKLHQYLIYCSTPEQYPNIDTCKKHMSIGNSSYIEVIKVLPDIVITVTED